MLLHSKKIIKHSRKLSLETKSQYRSLLIGDVGLLALQGSRLHSRHLETIRIQIKNQIKRQARIFIRSWPQVAITKKPEETRMGKGKGNVKHKVSMIRPAQAIVELRGNTLRLKMATVIKKLPGRSMLFNKRLRWIY